MRKFWKAFLCFYRGFAWTNFQMFDSDDTKVLEMFWRSSPGAKLLNELKAQAFEQDRQATLEGKDRAWQAGVATGYRMAIALIESKSFSVTSPTAEGEEYERVPERSGKDRFAQNSR